jgi:error-prone DNA polymerase
VSASGSESSPAGYQAPPARFASIEHLIACSGIHRDELTTLAEVGALNAFGYDRRTALWQIERAIRPAGELFQEVGGRRQEIEDRRQEIEDRRQETEEGTQHQAPGTSSPLPPMTSTERLVSDYAGTGLTIGPHPMAFKRPSLVLGGVLRAIDLPRQRNGRRVRVAGAVITRQRPGTAKGFVFLTLEDETGIANIIVRPDLFAADRVTIVGEPFLLVEGTLQIQDGVTSVKADRVQPLPGNEPAPESHDFH